MKRIITAITLAIALSLSCTACSDDPETCEDYCVQLFECMAETKGSGSVSEEDWKKCIDNCEEHNLAGTGYYPQCEGEE